MQVIHINVGIYCYVYDGENERICSEYGDCPIPFYECTFQVLGLRLPFNAFKMKVIKHMVLNSSQLQLARWAYVKIFQYQYIYSKGKPSLALFFHLLKSHHGPMTRTRGRGLVSLVPTVWGFRVFFLKACSILKMYYFLLPLSSPKLMQRSIMLEAKWMVNALSCSPSTEPRPISSGEMGCMYIKRKAFPNKSCIRRSR